MPKSDYYTYRELLEALKELTPEQLDMTATVYVYGEDFYPINNIGLTTEDDILDEGHPYFQID